MREMTFDEAIEALKHAVYGEEVRYAIARALELSMNTQQSVAGKEDASNKVVSMDSNSTDVQYPSAKSVYDALSGKENSSNKKTTLTGNESSDNFYPTTKAVHDAIKNLEAIPTEVKLAMDTLFSKAAYAGDDAASSYATFHAWAMGTLTLFDWDYTEGMNGTIKSVTSVEPTMTADGLLLQGGENLYSICAIAPNIATLTGPYKTTITYSDLSADADNAEVMFYHYHATEGRVAIGRQKMSTGRPILKTFVTDESNQQTVLSWNLTDSGTIEIEYDNVAGTVKFTQGANSYTVTVGTVSEGVQHQKIASASKGSRDTSVKIQHIRIERTVQA